MGFGDLCRFCSSGSGVKAPLLPLLALSLLPALPSALRADGGLDVTLTPSADRIRIEVGGRLFSEYVFSGAQRPYLYPVLSADGTPMTRDYPMKNTPGEERDHPHHHSLWFAHGSVNGIDFWNEGTAGSDLPKGSIVQDALLVATSGPVAVLQVHDRWVAPDGTLICTDDRTLRIQGTADTRTLDFDVTIHALPEAPLHFGDEKDGTMAIRLAKWMTLPHMYGKTKVSGVGHVLTSAGDKDAEAWGKRADWADYDAPLNGKIYGVAIFDNPANLRHPTYWMARDYGLFAANPFGKHYFENAPDPHAGDYTVPAGGNLTLRYRFFFHEGDPASAGVAAQYQAYAQTK
jgi:hypothetical protein